MNLKSKIIRKIKSIFFFQSLKKYLSIDNSYLLNFYGSPYGGWHIYEKYLDSNSVVISCGAGEDISFDIELLKKFNCKLHLFDPTPRAIEHISNVFKNSKNYSSIKYTNTGKQDIGSYELEKVSLENLYFYEKAVWNQDTQLKFFLPPNKNHVSHSINNYQNNYDQNTDHIIVSAINLAKFLQNLDIFSIDLIKLDIEGAEIEVIENLLESNLQIKQICVEFDELHLNTKNSKKRMLKIYRLLSNAGYKCINSYKSVNYTFLLNN